MPDNDADGPREVVTFNRNRLSHTQWSKLPTVIRAKFMVYEPPTGRAQEARDEARRRIRARTAEAGAIGVSRRATLAAANGGGSGLHGEFDPSQYHDAAKNSVAAARSSIFPTLGTDAARLMGPRKAVSAAPRAAYHGQTSKSNAARVASARLADNNNVAAPTTRSLATRSAPVRGSTQNPSLAHIRATRAHLAQWKDATVQALVEGQPSAITAIVLKDVISRPTSSYVPPSERTVTLLREETDRLHRLVCRATDTDRLDD
ncbi:hypothetical protein H9P43_006357 [Blastocladiella emersonii ATCC 22665]|nr:hypothetical protein H9P43_006357 [Blastocladiella emersonii ATCC 22665]